MPYGYRKSGDKITVFKKKPDGSTEVVGHTTASKLKGYLAALHMHSKDMKEISKPAKAAKIEAANKKVISLKIQLKDAQDELRNANKEPIGATVSTATKAAKIKAAQEKIKLMTKQIQDALKELTNAKNEPVNMSENFSLSNYIKSIREAEGDAPEDAPAEDAPDAGDTGGMKGAADEKPAEDDKETKAAEPDNLTVKFNMAAVMKYNQYPVTDNTGTVTGVTKNGMSVQVGDNIIFVDFKDLLD